MQPLFDHSFKVFQAYQHFLYYINIQDIKDKKIWGAHLTAHFAEKFTAHVSRTGKGYAAVEAIVSWIQEMTRHNQEILLEYIIENHSNKW